MTEVPVRTWATENPAVTDRIKNAVNFKAGKPFSEAIHEAAAQLQMQVGWHEADVLAEALGHHYTHTVQNWQVFDPRVDEDMVSETLAYLRRELLVKADDDGLSLVEHPVESWYVTDHLPADGEPVSSASHEMTRAKAWAIAERKTFGWYVMLVLTGKCRKLASAS